MTFLHLGLLPLAALAVVPILLHLLTLHRLRTVELSTYRFLFDSYVQQRRQMKFLEALLALLRTLFMLALVLVVCRPVVRHWSGLFGGGSGREVVMLVDCSASMNAKTGGVSALERAKAAALSIAGRLGREDRLTLVRLGARPQEVFSRFSSDAETIREKIEALAPGPSRANYFAGLSSVFGPQAKREAKPAVYLFTDGQAGSWREVRDHGLERIIPEGVRLTVVNVGSDEPMANRGVIGDAPRQRRAILGLPVRLRPRVVNHSKTEAADVAVGVILDEKEVARLSFHLEPGAAASKEIVHIPSEPGVLRGRFEIPGDRFPDDDSFDFTLTVVPQVPVVLVNGNPAADPFENEALFLRTALTTTAEGDRAPSPSGKPAAGAAGLGPSKEFVRSLDVREVPEGQLNAETLRDAGVVILANCGALNPTQFTALRDFVSGGGGLLVFPGDKVNPDAYNAQFFRLPTPKNPRNRPARRAPAAKNAKAKAKTPAAPPTPAGPAESLFTGAKLGPADGDPAKPETFERLATIDFGHPALSVFDDPEAHYLTTAQFLRRFPLVPDESHDAWPLARFTAGAPALVEAKFGEGVVILAAFPVNTKWTNLPLKPEFVPLALRLVSYAAHAPELDVPSTVPADGAAEIAVAGTWSPASGKVTDAKGRTTPLALERSATQLLGEFDLTSEKGYYAVEVKGGRLDPPQVASSAFAVNTAPDESNFAAVSEDQVRDWLPTPTLAFVNASAEAQQTHGAIGDEREVWRPLIFVLFAIIGVEFMLATRSGQGPVTDDDRTVSRRIRDLNPGTWVGRMTGAGASGGET